MAEDNSNLGETSPEIEEILQQFRGKILLDLNPDEFYRSSELWDDPKWVEAYNAVQFDETLENRELRKFVRSLAKKTSKDSNVLKPAVVEKAISSSPVLFSSNESPGSTTSLPNTQELLDNNGIDLRKDDNLKKNQQQ